MIDCFIKRMTVLGRGLVFQPVLVTQTCTYNSNNITLQNIDITDFPSKKKKKKKKGTYQPPPHRPTRPKKTTTHKQTNKQKKKQKQKQTNHPTTKESTDTSKCFDVSLKLSKLHVKK